LRKEEQAKKAEEGNENTLAHPTTNKGKKPHRSTKAQNVSY